MKHDLLLTLARLDDRKLFLEGALARVILATDILSQDDYKFEVHIPAGWPEQYPVASKRLDSLTLACADVLEQFKQKNGGHLSVSSFPKKLHVFLIADNSDLLLGITTEDVMGILRNEGSVRNEGSEFHSDYFSNSVGIWEYGKMPNIWFVGSEGKPS